MKMKLYKLVAAVVLFSLGTYAQNDQISDTIRYNQYGQKVDWVSLYPEAQDGILNFTSKDGNYRLWLDNRVQFDAAIFPSDVLNPIGNGTMIRRARFAVKTILWKNWYGEIDMDFSGSAVELKDAMVKYTFNSENVNIKAGHFRESFGMETLTTSRYVTFIERSLSSKLDPSRHIGLQMNYWGHNYLLTGGVHFNTIGDLEEVTYTQDFNKDQGLDEGYSFTGRAVFNPVLDNDKVLHLGIAGSYRTPKTNIEIPNSFRFSTRQYSSINRKKYIDTDDILNVDHTTLMGFELAGKYKNLMIQGEYKKATVTRMENLSSVSIEGYYFQTAVLLFGGNYNYNQNDGEFTRITPGKKYGDMELAFKYDFVDANDFKAEVLGGSAESYTVGLNYHFNPNVKFMVNYIYNNLDRFANGKGKLYVGHDMDGNLTKDPAEVVETKGNAGDDFGMMSFRIEIDF